MTSIVTILYTSLAYNNNCSIDLYSRDLRTTIILFSRNVPSHKTDWIISERHVFTQDIPNSYWISRVVFTYNWLNSNWIAVACSVLQSDECTCMRMSSSNWITVACSVLQSDESTCMRMSSRNHYKCKLVRACRVVVDYWLLICLSAIFIRQFVVACFFVCPLILFFFWYGHCCYTFVYSLIM